MLNIAQIVLKTVGIIAQHSTQSTQQYYITQTFTHIFADLSANSNIFQYGCLLQLSKHVCR